MKLQKRSSRVLAGKNLVLPREEVSEKCLLLFCTDATIAKSCKARKMQKNN